MPDPGTIEASRCFGARVDSIEIPISGLLRTDEAPEQRREEWVISQERSAGDIHVESVFLAPILRLTVPEHKWQTIHPQ